MEDPNRHSRGYVREKLYPQKTNRGIGAIRDKKNEALIEFRTTHCTSQQKRMTKRDGSWDLFKNGSYQSMDSVLKRKQRNALSQSMQNFTISTELIDEVDGKIHEQLVKTTHQQTKQINLLFPNLELSKKSDQTEQIGQETSQKAQMNKKLIGVRSDHLKKLQLKSDNLI